MDCPLFDSVPDGDELIAAGSVDEVEDNMIWSIRSTTSVSSGARIGGRDYVRNVATYYNFTTVKDPQVEYIVEAGQPAVGSQTVSEMRSILDAYVTKGGSTFGGVEEGTFDWRSVSAACGLLSACHTFGAEDNFDWNAPQIVLLSERTVSLDLTSVVVTRALYRNGLEFNTLVAILRNVGIRTVYVADTLLPAGNGRLADLALAQYCISLHLRILESANACNCAASHEAAYVGGVASVIRLHSHSDEGGWFRSVMTDMLLPTVSGVCGYVGSTVRELDLRSGMGRALCAQIIISRLLCAVQAWGCADEGEVIEGHRRVTMLKNTVTGPINASRWIGLEMWLTGAIKNWLRCIEKSYNLTESPSVVFHSYDRIFREQTVDRHFGTGNSSVCPGFFVAVGPLTKAHMPRPCYESFTLLNTDKNVQLTNGCVVVPSSVRYNESGGRPVSQSRAVLDFRNTNLSEQGFRFLLSVQVNGAEDGLIMFRQQDLPNTGRDISRPVFTREANVMSDQTLTTPHCPFPLPFEGMIGDRPSTYIYTSDGRKGAPTVNDLRIGSINCMSSRLAVVGVHTDSFDVLYPGIYKDRRNFARKLHTYEIMGEFVLDEFELLAMATNEKDTSRTAPTLRGPAVVSGAGNVNNPKPVLNSGGGGVTMVSGVIVRGGEKPTTKTQTIAQTTPLATDGGSTGEEQKQQETVAGRNTTVKKKGRVAQAVSAISSVVSGAGKKVKEQKEGPLPVQETTSNLTTQQQLDSSSSTSSGRRESRIMTALSGEKTRELAETQMELTQNFASLDDFASAVAGELGSTGASMVTSPHAADEFSSDTQNDEFEASADN